MKSRIGLIVLGLVAIGFGVALIIVEKRANDREAQDAKTIGTYSNKWVRTTADLAEQAQVSAINEKKVESQNKVLEQFTNSLSEAMANLAETSSNLALSQTSLKTSQEEIAKRDTKIAELENQNHALDAQAVELSNAITNLTMEIADTKRRLAASEGDKTFLEGQLKRLLAEKSELERQFSDISVLRAQVKKLREEIVVARRIEWTRQGVYARAEQKGAQRLMQGAPAPQVKQPTRPNYDLSAEINSQGGARILSPTNHPPATNAPAK